ncbi:hypothetical protein [Acinetobacter pollinis]|uniref:hypothetical protein n=1 Tax=Acinetobacter pollinis TaxID=2605270 RepID=UPI002DB89714|nr:hypothetical protein [Acinetobacter pollinis]
MTEQAQQEGVPATEQGQQEQAQTTALGGEQPNQQLQGGENGESNSPGEQQPTEQLVQSADDYKVELDGFDFNEFKGIEENKAFLDRAHQAGLSNDQLKFVLGEYSEIIPKVMEGVQQFKTEDCTASLQKDWGNNTKENLGLALKAAQSAGLTLDQINADPAIGNNPAVIKMLAHFGKQMAEDVPPKNTQQSSGEDIQQ